MTDRKRQDLVRPAFWNRFHVRITAIYSLAIFIVFVVTSILIYHAGVRAELSTLQTQIQTTAVALSVSINPADVLALRTVEDTGSPAHTRLFRAFEEIAKTYPTTESIYILRPTERQGHLVFVVDYVGDGEMGVTGDPYDATDVPVMLQGLVEPAVEQEPVGDEFGVSLSGYAPIRDESNKVIAVIGVDIDASRVEAIKKRVLLGTLLVFGLAAILITLSAFMVGRNVERPLTRVMDATEAIALGQFETRVGFERRDEFGLLGQRFDDMAEGLEERDFIRETFGRYVSEDVASSLLANREAIELGGEERVVTILFSDLRGYSTLSEVLSPTQIVSFLNAYLGGMNEVIEEHNGTVIEYLGDAILAVFGAPYELANHPVLAVRCAAAMRVRLNEQNDEWERSGLAELWKSHGLEAPAARIGVHTGKVVAGNLGSTTRMKYAVIGDTVNVAARLEQLNKELETDILFSEAVWNLLDDELREQVQDVGAHQVKGRAQAVHAYTLPNT